MTRADFLAARIAARTAMRHRDLLPPYPLSTWQDKDRAQQWVQTCVARLPGHAYVRPYSAIDMQTRLVVCAQFPQWAIRRLHLRQHRQREAMRGRITDAVAFLGASIVEQNIAAEQLRREVV